MSKYVGTMLAACAAATFGATPAIAEIQLGIDAGLINNDVCLSGTRLTTFNDQGTCAGTEAQPTRLTITGTNGYTNFDATTGNVDFNDNNVSFNSVTTAFGGGSVSFNNTVTFTGPSVTFGTGTTFNNSADFNAAITTSGITNTGIISSDTLSGNSIFGNSATITNILSANGSFTDSLTVVGPATVDMGGNIIHNVGAGVADTDAVNVAQLNAATSGITADVTALETVTATHTTQIATLQSDVGTLEMDVSDLQTDLLAETASRLAADTALDSRVDALEAIANGLDERFDDVNDRAAAGTATAVALSGAMFLPGKTYNLTGNVGAYRGAVAGAVQFGAMVSPNAAFNAGVAKGFNKKGKTALRAGFTIGW